MSPVPFCFPVRICAGGGWKQPFLPRSYAGTYWCNWKWLIFPPVFATFQAGNPLEHKKR